MIKWYINAVKSQALADTSVLNAVLQKILMIQLTLLRHAADVGIAVIQKSNEKSIME